MFFLQAWEEESSLCSQCLSPILWTHYAQRSSKAAWQLHRSLTHGMNRMSKALKVPSCSFSGEDSQNAVVYLFIVFRSGLSISWMILVLPESCFLLLSNSRKSRTWEQPFCVQTPICHRTCPTNWPHQRVYKNKIRATSSSPLRYSFHLQQSQTSVS